MKGFKQGAQTGGLVSHGKTMGFKHGGQVKQSPQFAMKIGSMKQKPTGELRGEPANEDDKVLGGKSTLMPGYKEGGYVKCKHGGRMAYKKGGKYYLMKGGKMHPYMKGGVHSTYRMDDPGGEKTAMKKRGKGVVGKMHGGAVHAGASGAKHDYPGRNRVGPNPDRSQGEEKQPAQRGAKHVGKGGKTGQHKGYRISK